jgi:hypothetical protein
VFGKPQVTMFELIEPVHKLRGFALFLMKQTIEGRQAKKPFFMVEIATLCRSILLYTLG